MIKKGVKEENLTISDSDDPSNGSSGDENKYSN